jgi:hypothetical protein
MLTQNRFRPDRLSAITSPDHSYKYLLVPTGTVQWPLLIIFINTHSYLTGTVQWPLLIIFINTHSYLTGTVQWPPLILQEYDQDWPPSQTGQNPHHWSPAQSQHRHFLD